MAEIVQDPLTGLSAALAERARLARPLVAGIAAPGHRMRSSPTLFRKRIPCGCALRFQTSPEPPTGGAGNE